MSEVQKESTTFTDTRRVINSLLATAVDVGSMWAVHGLKVGKMALSASAETLGKTASALETLATEIEKKHAPSAPPPAETPPGDQAVN